MCQESKADPNDDGMTPTTTRDVFQLPQTEVNETLVSNYQKSRSKMMRLEHPKSMYVIVTICFLGIVCLQALSCRRGTVGENVPKTNDWYREGVAYSQSNDFLNAV